MTSRAYVVQEYLVDGSNRTAVGGTFGMFMGQGPFGGGPTDYSTFDTQYEDIHPYEAVGKHEFECTARATAFDIEDWFEPGLRSTAVSAPFTGTRIERGLQLVHTYKGAQPCAVWGPCCAADLLTSGANWCMVGHCGPK
jgi:hypothetical protein